MRNYKIAYAVLYVAVVLIVATPLHGLISKVSPRIFGVPFSVVVVVLLAFLPSLALFFYDRKRFPKNRSGGGD